MPTESALGRRRAYATQRIESALSNLSGGRAFVLPTHTRHGQGMLLVNQLEAIADFLESPAPQSENTLTEEETSDAPPASDEPVLEDSAADESDDETPATEAYEGMTNAELEDLIHEHGLVKGKARSKVELIAVLEAADKETE